MEVHDAHARTKRNDTISPLHSPHILRYILHVYTELSFGSSFEGREGCGEEEVERLLNSDRDSLTRKYKQNVRFGKFTFHVLRWI